MCKTLIVLFGLTTVNVASQDLFIASFTEKWENSKNYLIAMAEAMPEDLYDYRPTSKQMSFKEQLQHIKGNMDWLSADYFGVKNGHGKKQEFHKADLIDALKTSFDRISSTIKDVNPDTLGEKVDFFAGEKTKMQILNLMQDHVTHHRGQLIVYLNLNQITPPKYVGW